VLSASVGEMLVKAREAKVCASFEREADADLECWRMLEVDVLVGIVK